MALAEQGKRARSADQKEQRKAAILAAARGLIAEVGFDGVKMAALARRAGLAKGTLYLYVRSKEELFLALFVAALTEFAVQLETEARRETLAADITRIALDVPLFLPLFARLVAVIEANVADEPLFAAKREIGALTQRIDARLGRLLGLDPEASEAVSSALVLAMQGAAQFDITAQRDPATVPDDLKPVIAAQAFAQRFPPAARLILSGLA